MDSTHTHTRAFKSTSGHKPRLVHTHTNTHKKSKCNVCMSVYVEGFSVLNVKMLVFLSQNFSESFLKHLAVYRKMHCQHLFQRPGCHFSALLVLHLLQLAAHCTKDRFKCYYSRHQFSSPVKTTPFIRCLTSIIKRFVMDYLGPHSRIFFLS